jgi:hypothetical protein
MGKVKQISTCYYCGAPATSREHVPPDVFRKKIPGIEKIDAITVPSCYLHNEAKHKIDQAVYNAFALPIHSILGTSIQILSSQVNMMVRAKTKNFRHQKELTIAIPLRGPEIGDTEASLAYTIVNWNKWIRLLTAGQLFVIHGEQRPNIDWESCVVYNWDYVPGSRGLEISTETIHNALGSNESMYNELSEAEWYNATTLGPLSTPEFSYTFRIGKTQAVWTMEHVFLGQYRIWCSMKLSDEAEEKLVWRLHVCQEEMRRKSMTHN